MPRKIRRQFRVTKMGEGCVMLTRVCRPSPVRRGSLAKIRAGAMLAAMVYVEGKVTEGVSEVGRDASGPQAPAGLAGDGGGLGGGRG